MGGPPVVQPDRRVVFVAFGGIDHVFVAELEHRREVQRRNQVADFEEVVVLVRQRCERDVTVEVVVVELARERSWPGRHVDETSASYPR